MFWTFLLIWQFLRKQSFVVTLSEIKYIYQTDTIVNWIVRDNGLKNIAENNNSNFESLRHSTNHHEVVLLFEFLRDLVNPQLCCD